MVTRFEAAADAIISSDITTLKKLLQENPALIRQRSTREHRATLLHYASANDVEGYRQKTPQNIVEIAELLLKSGAEVDTEADAVADHHAYLDAVGSNFVRELRPEAFIIPSWYVSHPAALPLRRMLSRKLYAGDRDVYATCVMEENRIFNNQFISKVKS